MERARTRLSVVAPFFGSLALRHEMTATDAVPTAAVDKHGRILYNPEWCGRLTMAEALFVLAHETMHVVFAHLARRGDRDVYLWNVANDAIINEIIAKELGSYATPINGCVSIAGASEFSSEQLYEKLKQEQDGDATPPPLVMPDLQGDAGGSEDKGLSEAEAREVIADAKAELAAAATAAKMCGNLSADMKRFIGEFIQSRVPWYSVLERYLTGRAQQHQSWSRPNKRYLRRCYLPRRDRMPGMGEIVIGIDTSGSVTMGEWQTYFGHVNAIIEQCHPSQVTVVYCDYSVSKVDEFTPDEYPIAPREVIGGGGTDMRSICKWIAENRDDVSVAVVFTDGYTPTPEPEDVPCPLVWVCTTDEFERNPPRTGDVITDHKEG